VNVQVERPQLQHAAEVGAEAGSDSGEASDAPAVRETVEVAAEDLVVVADSSREIQVHLEREREELVVLGLGSEAGAPAPACQCTFEALAR
jgi:hypothetical protein